MAELAAMVHLRTSQLIVAEFVHQTSLRLRRVLQLQRTRHQSKGQLHHQTRIRQSTATGCQRVLLHSRVEHYLQTVLLQPVEQPLLQRGRHPDFGLAGCLRTFPHSSMAELTVQDLEMSFRKVHRCCFVRAFGFQRAKSLETHIG